MSFSLLAALFVAVPLVELALLIWVGDRVGLVPTVVLVVVTGIAGAALARHQGLLTLRRFHAALQRGSLPQQAVAEGILLLVAAAVLVTPGLLTDVAGFLLLVPPLRRAVARRMIEHLSRGVVVLGSAGGAAAGAPRRREPGSEVIDADFTVGVEEEGEGGERPGG